MVYFKFYFMAFLFGLIIDIRLIILISTNAIYKLIFKWCGYKFRGIVIYNEYKEEIKIYLKFKGRVLDDFLKLYNHAYLDEVRLEEKNKG